MAEKVVAAVDSDRFDAMVLNYANPDMVGHTGMIEAGMKAVEAVDRCLERTVERAKAKGWTVLITADHGNCEQMQDYETGQPHTYHTTNPVPFVVVNDDRVGQKLRGGESFKSIAPTMLDVMGIERPEEMMGRSLLGG